MIVDRRSGFFHRFVSLSPHCLHIIHARTGQSNSAIQSSRIVVSSRPASSQVTGQLIPAILTTSITRAALPEFYTFFSCLFQEPPPFQQCRQKLLEETWNYAPALSLSPLFGVALPPIHPAMDQGQHLISTLHLFISHTWNLCPSSHKTMTIERATGVTGEGGKVWPGRTGPSIRDYRHI